MGHQLHATIKDIEHLAKGGGLLCPKCDQVAERAADADLDIEWVQMMENEQT
jgi:hypothetical protein